MRDKKSEKKYRENIQENIQILFISLGIFVIPLFDLFSKTIPAGFGYVDDFFALVCLSLLSYRIMYLQRINKYLLMIIVLIAIGLIGNIVFGIQKNTYVVLADAFLFAKPYIIFFYIYLCVKRYNAVKIYKNLTFFSKAMLNVMFFLAITSKIFLLANFADLGMYLDNNAFHLYSGFGGVVANWTMFFLSIIYSSKKNNRFFYYLISLVIIIHTISGLAMLSMVLLGLIYLIIEKRRYFKWYYLLIIVPICIWVGRKEIINYLLNSNAPRHILFYYSFVTANTFFPIGSGFATYGSTMAAQKYSQLYIRYGFNYIHGMTQEHTSFLLDSYYPLIIGQMGYIGIAIFFMFIYLIYSKFITKIKDINIFCACLWLYLIWCVSGLGFTSGVWGSMVFCIIALWTAAGKSAITFKTNSLRYCADNNEKGTI